ncbi:tRNA pseudouridine(38-40) synthase TruA [Sulfurospirillum diekertiae]|uniref:tRNA pseudouridine synthase A n=1 Tax=Sulfurospirillum diekertiae TaxID=1854492 RepID=A0A6G9VVU5_9BACT|nr:tRNA pseudouridine(38-40) synthase TruA [Sulfurospirillum diekertiae]QIR77128.1 tRNA pseudouridine(38-40) synthase TruA [Sulfurospirillum diekertiae]QIR79743.1 tRNA pseudouridine(38-40) synthase TruA [Sulfurospirillum diekertiae]
MRVKITLSYDGSAFVGFQIQKNETKTCQSVAGVITRALRRVNIDATVVGSGRTDTGVHATHQVLHIDLPVFWNDLEKLQSHLNGFLAPYIFIQSIIPVDASFHARFNAKKRLYRYILYDGAYQPFLANYALHVKALNVMKLNEYAQVFVGFHNFEYFKKLGGGTTKDERTIFKAGAYRYKNLIIIYFLGDAFLRSQVRMMCGSLLKVCHNELSLDDLIAQRERKMKVSTTLIPACGLYLSKVFY